MALAVVREISVYDLRKEDVEYKMIRLTNVERNEEFITGIQEGFSIGAHEEFVLCDTNRDAICDDRALAKLRTGDTVYILWSLFQELPTQTKEKIQFLPHYDTLVKSGMYEYYASEGQDPLPFALAELIDNSLTATAEIEGMRRIELRLMLSSTVEKTMVIVLDNGKGMTPRQLNDWAIYRKSKFMRDSYRPEPSGYVPRSLNSNMSYFGVGGKQGSFFVGNSLRVITRIRGKMDVHEFLMSEANFKTRDSSGEDMYADYIYNRQPGDYSHLDNTDEYIKKLIGEEHGKENFTAVVIHGVNLRHLEKFKSQLDEICTHLAHTYHYYVHGVHGNMETKKSSTHIEIMVNLYKEGKKTRAINLRDTVYDNQSLLIRSAADSFEFKAFVKGAEVVEGIIRYHPFLYDKETYPKIHTSKTGADEEHDYFVDEIRPARGKKPIFECFWNGRLIPYTSIDEFEWCAIPKRSSKIPVECYNRLSGVLWADDLFEVSTNKLTFLDLEVKLKDKSTSFSYVVNGQTMRGNIEKYFKKWLLQCHSSYDKQVRYCGFLEKCKRLDLPSKRQYPWSTYKSLEWDKNVITRGQMIRVSRLVPPQYGTVTHFLVYGDEEGDVYASNGFVEYIREPKLMYGELKIQPCSKIDRMTSKDAIHRWINEELKKLPQELVFNWPEGDEIAPGRELRAGDAIGPIQVMIMNRKGEIVTFSPGSNQRKLGVELKIVCHESKGDKVVHQACEQAVTQLYTFKKIKTIVKVGSYTMHVTIAVKDLGLDCNSELVKVLPTEEIEFTVFEAETYLFSVRQMDRSISIGEPFDLRLDFTDKFGNPTTPSPDLKPNITVSGLQLLYNKIVVKENCLVVKGIEVYGSVKGSTGHNFVVSTSISGLRASDEMVTLRVLPGCPAKLEVLPANAVVSIENWKSLIFNVHVQDISGNPANITSEVFVTCTFQSLTEDLEPYTAKISAFGRAVLTGPPIRIKGISGSEEIKALIEIQGSENVPSVEKTIKVLPSRRPSKFQLKYRRDNGLYKEIKEDEILYCTAGETVKEIGFMLYDESGLPVEMQQSFTNLIKVNWVSRVPKDHIMNWKLPSIAVPSAISESKYCSVAMGLNVSLGFTIKSIPGKATSLVATCVGSNKVRLGQLLKSTIEVFATDRHDNMIEEFTEEISNISVTCEGLSGSKCVAGLSESTILVKDVSFKSGPLGRRLLEVGWRNLVQNVILELVAGPPASVIFSGYDMSTVTTVVNNRHLDTPLVVQLVDERGNLCSDWNYAIELIPHKNLKFFPAFIKTTTNEQGNVDYGTPILTTDIQSKAGDCPEELCCGNCFGVVTLDSVVYVCKPVAGPSLLFHVLPDPCKPVRVEVQCNEVRKFYAGESLEEYKVSIITEADGIYHNAVASQLVMLMWEIGKLHLGKLTISPSSEGRSTATPGVFYFRNQHAPEAIGSYHINFEYKDGRGAIYSAIKTIDVLPCLPVKLTPLDNFATPTVSNKSPSDRVIMKHLKLELRDMYGNLAGQELQGDLLIKVMNDFDVKEIPVLRSGLKSIQIPLVKGQALLNNIEIDENSQGLDGQEYYLKCTVISNGLPRHHIIPPYNIPFIFCFDTKKHQAKGLLMQERDDLREAIAEYNDFFVETEQLHKALQGDLHKFTCEDQKLKGELGNLGIDESRISAVDTVVRTLTTVVADRENILGAPRRTCGLSSAPNDPQVVGKIGHLACIREDEIARVLSWHMAPYMDCIVTRTLQKAEEINRRARGNQLVFALEVMYCKDLVQGRKRTLPHTKIPGQFVPPGNPIHAMALLTFPAEVDQECKMVFGRLLGDTLIIDTASDATKYRKEVVKYAPCPTILTKDGNRIESVGVFGGKNNCAPSLSEMRNAVFGKPDELDMLNVIIDLLQKQCANLKNISEASKALEKHLLECQGELMVQRKRECEEKEAKLLEIEKELDIRSSSHKGLDSATTANGRQSSCEPLKTSGRRRKQHNSIERDDYSLRRDVGSHTLRSSNSLPEASAACSGSSNLTLKRRSRRCSASSTHSAILSTGDDQDVDTGSPANTLTKTARQSRRVSIASVKRTSKSLSPVRRSSLPASKCKNPPKRKRSRRS